MMTTRSKPALSLVVAVYQRDDFLEKVFLSLLNQTLGDFEIVIADDGSGPAIAKIKSDAKPSRNNVSHHGLLAGVSSRLMSFCKITKGGKISVVGLGGVRRSRYQITGSKIKAAKTSGYAKARGRPNITGLSLVVIGSH